MSKPKSKLKDLEESLIIANVGCLFFGGLIIALPCLLLSSVFVYQGWREAVKQGKQLDQAVETSATVIRNQLPKISGARSEERKFFTDIEFSYSYDGNAFTSTNLWPIPATGTASEMRAIIERYPVGSKTQAYVSPAFPNEAFLEKKWNPLSYLSWIMGSLTVGGFTSLMLLMTGWKRPSPAITVSIFISIGTFLLPVTAWVHYGKHLPENESSLWMLISFIIALGVSLLPMACIRRVYKLNGIYRRATERKGRCIL